MTTHQIKCGKCDLPLQGPADPQPHDTFFCPRCGESGSFENVLAEVGEDVAERAAESIGAAFDNAFRNSKFIKVTTHHNTKKAHRFIVDYKPPV